MPSDRVWKGRWFRWWRKIRTESAKAAIRFTPELKMNRDHGWVSLELVLVNDAAMTVWVEEAIVVLTDFDTSWQTSIPTGEAKHEIRQNVRAKELLGLSLATVVYDAAGRPQGRYSCLIFVNIRCRVGDEWFDKALDTFQVKMTGLKPRALRRLRWYEKRARPRLRRIQVM